MSGRNLPLYGTLTTLITIQGHQKQKQKTRWAWVLQLNFVTALSLGSEGRGVSATGRSTKFLTFSVLVAGPKKTLYTVDNLARGLLNRDNTTKRESLAALPPSPTLLIHVTHLHA